MIFLFTPAGFDEFLMEVGKPAQPGVPSGPWLPEDNERIATIGPRYGRRTSEDDSVPPALLDMDGQCCPPDTEHPIGELRTEIDVLDQEICALVRRRTILSRCIGAIRASADGPRIVESREQEIRYRYGELGVPGYELAVLLLRLGRGPDSEAS